MINYRGSNGFVIFSANAFSLPCFKNALLIASFSAGLSVAFFLCRLYLGLNIWSSGMQSAFTAFSSMTTFLIVFRTSSAQARFWEGSTLMYKMVGGFFDGTSSLVAFCSHNRLCPIEVTEFEQMIVRLVSLLNCVILAELEGSDSHEKKAFTYELIDVHGIEHAFLAELREAEQKPEVVFHWIQCLIVENVTTGVLSIPAPLLTRTFQDFGNAMLTYHELLKYACIPLPFPYAAATEVLLGLHTIMTPVASCAWSTRLEIAAFFSFILVLVPWMLHLLAGELENPFEADANDLDMASVQREVNSRIVALLIGAGRATPKLSVTPSTAVDNLKSQWANGRTTITNCLMSVKLAQPVKSSWMRDSRKSVDDPHVAKLPLMSTVVSPEDVEVGVIEFPSEEDVAEFSFGLPNSQSSESSNVQVCASDVGESSFTCPTHPGVGTDTQRPFVPHFVARLRREPVRSSSSSTVKPRTPDFVPGATLCPAVTELWHPVKDVVMSAEDLHGAPTLHTCHL